MRQRLTKRGEQRRRQIVDLSARRFATQGYHATSITDIVNELKVGKGVFYWYFSSKEELFREILLTAQHDLRRLQQAAIEGEDDPLRRIELGIRASLDWLGKHRHLFMLFHFAAGDERFSSMIRKGEQVAVEDATRHLKEAIAAGQIREADPTVLGHAILGVINHLTRVLIFELGEPMDRVVDETIAFCLFGLKASTCPSPASKGPDPSD
ncbi:MAG: TetR/AcrR family transcriptional regulator [Actinobacteria bacterium]|nr:TetR/AcrR family transcriptional regulator [Actinomycetota bacterium]